MIKTEFIDASTVECFTEQRWPGLSIIDSNTIDEWRFFHDELVDSGCCKFPIRALSKVWFQGVDKELQPEIITIDFARSLETEMLEELDICSESAFGFGFDPYSEKNWEDINKGSPGPVMKNGFVSIANIMPRFQARNAAPWKFYVMWKIMFPDLTPDEIIPLMEASLQMPERFNVFNAKFSRKGGIKEHLDRRANQFNEFGEGKDPTEARTSAESTRQGKNSKVTLYTIPDKMCRPYQCIFYPNGVPENSTVHDGWLGYAPGCRNKLMGMILRNPQVAKFGISRYSGDQMTYINGNPATKAQTTNYVWQDGLTPEQNNDMFSTIKEIYQEIETTTFGSADQEPFLFFFDSFVPHGGRRFNPAAENKPLVTSYFSMIPPAEINYQAASFYFRQFCFGNNQTSEGTCDELVAPTLDLVRNCVCNEMHPAVLDSIGFNKAAAENYFSITRNAFIDKAKRAKPNKPKVLSFKDIFPTAPFASDSEQFKEVEKIQETFTNRLQHQSVPPFAEHLFRNVLLRDSAGYIDSRIWPTISDQQFTAQIRDNTEKNKSPKPKLLSKKFPRPTEEEEEEEEEFHFPIKKQKN